MPTKIRYEKIISKNLCPECGKHHNAITKYCPECLKRYRDRRHGIPLEPRIAKCSTCKIKFKVNKNGRVPKYCPNCKKHNTLKWYKKWKSNPEVQQHLRTYAREYRKNWRNTKYKNYLDISLRTKYNLTLEQFDSMFKKQNGKCAICGFQFVDWKTPTTKGKKDIHVDHNHSTNKVRGLLCSRCNVGIGLLKENISILQSAIKYLSNQ
jgi:uncharacterized Zn finger protein (UPF0148 family)